MKKLFDLQLFADDAPANPAPSGTDTKPTDTDKPGEQPDKGKGAEPKYTDADLDKIISQKFAKWKQDQEKAVDEAKKLAEMDAQQKAEYERDKLQKELDELKRKDALAEMSKVARKMLSDENITVPDELLSMMVTTDAKETKTAIDGFAKLFKDSVENAVKERLKGKTPPRGAGGGDPISEIQKRINKYA